MTSNFLLFFCSLLLLLQQITAMSSESSLQDKQNNFVGFTLTAAGNDSCLEFSLYKNLYEEMNSQNHPKIQLFYNRVVQKFYETQPANVLFQQLWQIYKKCDPSTFVAMVRAQLSLFWLHNMNEYPDFDYLLMVANGLYKIRNYFLYPSLNGRTRLLFERAMKSLPSTLHYLFGHQEFCLMNRKHMEIMYQTESDEFVMNHEIRFGFTWHMMKRFNDGKGKIIPLFKNYNITLLIVEPEALEINNKSLLKANKQPPTTYELMDIPTTLNLALFSKHFKNFYSRWPVYNQKIGGNLTTIPEYIWQQEYHVWSVQLVDDDHLVFFQNQYLMCATSFYDDKRRFIFGLQNRTVYDTDCQWSAGKCDRR